MLNFKETRSTDCILQPNVFLYYMDPQEVDERV
jgi:hypothetical protein